MCLSRSQSLFPAEIFFVTKTWGGGGGVIVDTTPNLNRGGMHPPSPRYLRPCIQLYKILH